MRTLVLFLTFQIQNWRRGIVVSPTQVYNMAAAYGHVGPFDEITDKFADHARRYEAFMVVNEIAGDRQVHVFLAVVEPQAYKWLKNLFDPDNPNSKSNQELKQILQAHYEPAPCNSDCRKT